MIRVPWVEAKEKKKTEQKNRPYLNKRYLQHNICNNGQIIRVILDEESIYNCENSFLKALAPASDKLWLRNVIIAPWVKKGNVTWDYRIE